MGRKQGRAKGIDVTRNLLQSTSVSDYIIVSISQNQTIQVSEDELNPTAGSEAAFALRRDGKLDSSMKLCLNWKGGSCHNHAACTFAHVNSYFNVANGSNASAPAVASNPASPAPNVNATPPATTTTNTSATTTTTTNNNTTTTTINNNNATTNTNTTTNNNINSSVERPVTPPASGNTGNSWVSLVASGRSPEAKTGANRGLPPQASWGSARVSNEVSATREEPSEAEVEKDKKNSVTRPPAVPFSTETKHSNGEPLIGVGDECPESPLQWLTQQRAISQTSEVPNGVDQQQIKLKLLQELTGEPVPLSSTTPQPTNHYAQLFTGNGDGTGGGNPAALNRDANFFALTGSNPSNRGTPNNYVPSSGYPMNFTKEPTPTSNPMSQLMSLLTSDN